MDNVEKAAAMLGVSKEEAQKEIERVAAEAGVKPEDVQPVILKGPPGEGLPADAVVVDVEPPLPTHIPEILLLRYGKAEEKEKRVTAEMAATQLQIRLLENQIQGLKGTMARQQQDLGQAIEKRVTAALAVQMAGKLNPEDGWDDETGEIHRAPPKKEEPAKPADKTAN